MCVVVEIYILIYLSSCFTVTDSSVLKYISISLLSGPGETSATTASEFLTALYDIESKQCYMLER